jgi:poly(A) polymerase
VISFQTDHLPDPEKAFLVGGTVRDLLLGREPVDYDIAVLGNPAQTAAAFSESAGGRLVVMGKPDTRIYRVVTGKGIFDITPVAGASIEEDLVLRDFTFNAMAWSLSQKRLLDPAGGLRDLRNGIVRAVSSEAFVRDPIRLLRAFRLAAVYGFSLSPETVTAIGIHSDRIGLSAGERIREELLKTLRTPASSPVIRSMADVGLLDGIFPETTAMRGCRQNRHHAYDVFDHTLAAYEHLERLIESRDGHLPGGSVTDRKTAALLKCAMLLHDVGKPAVRSIDPRGRVHFYGHGAKGADIAAKITDRLKFSVRERRYVDFIIRNHIRALHLFIASEKGMLTPRGRTRFFRACGELAPALLLHTIADIQGKGTPGDERNDRFIEFAGRMLNEYLNRFKPAQANPPLITGKDLIEELGLRPSPLFRKILDRIEGDRLSRTLRTRAEALDRAREYLHELQKQGAGLPAGDDS